MDYTQSGGGVVVDSDDARRIGQSPGHCPSVLAREARRPPPIRAFQPETSAMHYSRDLPVARRPRAANPRRSVMRPRALLWLAALLTHTGGATMLRAHDRSAWRQREARRPPSGRAGDHVRAAAAHARACVGDLCSRRGRHCSASVRNRAMRAAPSTRRTWTGSPLQSRPGRSTLRAPGISRPCRPRRAHHR